MTMMSYCRDPKRPGRKRRAGSPLVALIESPVVALAVATHEKIHERLHFGRYEALVGMHGVANKYANTLVEADWSLGCQNLGA